MDQPMRCRRCGDVIGYYEPVVLITQERAHLTSAAAEPQIAKRHELLFHQACYAEEQHASDTP
jgi:hypothetical protein